MRAFGLETRKDIGKNRLLRNTGRHSLANSLTAFQFQSIVSPPTSEMLSPPLGAVFPHQQQQQRKSVVV
jgi:hypothetical protein